MIFKKKEKQVKEARIIEKDDKSAVAEQYRNIRTNILYSGVDEEMKSILITSANPSEGKTTTAANLAVLFAQKGENVILVDGDLRRPSLHYIFRLENDRGLTDILTKRDLRKRCIRQSHVENLHIMTCGFIPPNPAELLGSALMKRVIIALTQNYDRVIIDTPPILSVTDAHVLSNLVDGNVLVVRSKKTHIEEARKAKEILQGTSSKFLGTILNGYKNGTTKRYMY